MVAPETEDLWVVTDVTGVEGSDVREFGGLEKISPEKLGELLTQFTAKMGHALGQVQKLGQDWKLEEVCVSVSINGEIGIALVGKTGAEGGLQLTFRRVS